MVSTRSQSQLSGSTLRTGKDDGTTHGEVNSTEAQSRRSSRAARATQPSAQPAHLEAIEEEQPGAGRAQPRGEVGEDASLVDIIADAMFAALEAGLHGDSDGSDGEGESSQESDDFHSAREAQLGSQEESGDAVTHQQQQEHVPDNLLWQPELLLPGGTPATGRHQRSSSALLEGKPSGLAKLQHVPPPDQRARDRAARRGAPDTAGKAWFDLPATAITDEVKADLKVLRLRSAFDPKTFYKKFDTTKIPKHFQFGTVVEGAADFYSSRLTQRERKRTLAEEVMADPHLTAVRKRRYNKMQEGKAYTAGLGKQARKTDNPRLNKKPRRPKH